MAFLIKINLSVNATIAHTVMPYFLMLFLKSGLLKDNLHKLNSPF